MNTITTPLGVLTLHLNNRPIDFTVKVESDTNHMIKTEQRLTLDFLIPITSIGSQFQIEFVPNMSGIESEEGSDESELWIDVEHEKWLLAIGLFVPQNWVYVNAEKFISFGDGHAILKIQIIDEDFLESINCGIGVAWMKNTAKDFRTSQYLWNWLELASMPQ